MFSLKNWVCFFAGMAFFHTISHITLPYYFNFPLNLQWFTLTESMNNWIIGASAVVTLFLLWLAGKVKE